MAVQTQAQEQTTQLTRHRFTAEDFERMGEVGILHEDDRVELIEGDVVEMSPIGSPHAACVIRLTAIASSLGGVVLVSVQNPLHINDQTVPQPDIALLRPRADSYASALPTPADVLLLIEVADSTLATDRAVKLRLYAQAEVPETWLVNVNGGAIERHTEPRDGAYRQVVVGKPGDRLPSTTVPGLVIDVTAVLG